MKALTHFGIIAFLAKNGFVISPISILHQDKGSGDLTIDSQGFYFQPDNNEDPIELSWQQFEQGE